MKNHGVLTPLHCRWACILAAVCAFVMCGGAVAASQTDSDAPSPFVLTLSDDHTGGRLFESEDFVLLSNSSGELRLKVVGIVDRPFDARQALRFVFNDYGYPEFHILLSQSSQGVVSLTLAVPGVPALGFEKRPGESFVRSDGLLVPHTEVHREHILKYGIHTGVIENFMRSAIAPELLEALSRFKAFTSELELDDLIGAVGFRAAICDGIAGSSEGGSRKLDQGLIDSGDPEIQSASCVGDLLGLSGAVLSSFSGRLECAPCTLSRGGDRASCAECAALTGAAASLLIAAVIDCFGEDGDQPDFSPQLAAPPPVGRDGQPTLPQPIPIEGVIDGLLIPIYMVQSVDACVDAVCEPQSTVVILGWKWMWIFP